MFFIIGFLIITLLNIMYLLVFFETNIYNKIFSDKAEKKLISRLLIFVIYPIQILILFIVYLFTL